MLVDCAECGQKFDKLPSQVVRTQRHYCSKACFLDRNQSGSANAAWRGGLVVRSCSGCGKEYRRFLSAMRGIKRNYCSQTCQLADRAGESNPHWRGGKITRNCKECGEAFDVDPGSTKVLCGDVCRHARASRLRIYPDDKTMRRECSRRCEQRRRAAKHINTHTRAQWLALLERYKHRCAMCGSTKRLERDHIIAISRGGDDSIENIQPLCRHCNNSKHNKRIQLL